MYFGGFNKPFERLETIGEMKNKLNMFITVSFFILPSETGVYDLAEQT